MKKTKSIIFLIGLVFLLSFFIWQNKDIILTENQKVFNDNRIQDALYKVQKVIDGDTIVLDIDNYDQHVRIIGLNTPEARNFKNRKVECFGKEASQKAKEILENQEVKIKFDDNQSRYDKYGRLLAYIFFKDKDGRWVNFSEKMIADGYAYEFTYHGQKYEYQKIFKDAQKNAQEKHLGLWAPGVCKSRDIKRYDKVSN